ncbi:hypothetical protein [Winogradskyella wichelsiae]|uniref:hypothetical protein n=1 Tax=Winogradskyella wichelsiae TaxID=2697007 RepID=UPI0015C975B8|nr:hypothetical protein [Winogradskyella wichelsiae]
MTTKTEDYSRQLKYLLVLGDEILKEDGIFKEGTFFSKLSQFISFYKEIKTPLYEIIKSKKNNELPNHVTYLQTNLVFINYQYPALPIFILMLAFPLFAIGYFILKYLYVKKIKAKMRLLLQNLSSIHFIIDNNKH